MDQRTILADLICNKGETYASISALLGRNAAYIQQYIRRGRPSALSARDQDILARYFGMPADFLRQAPLASETAERNDTAAHIRAAIAGCERLRAREATVLLEQALAVVQQSPANLSNPHG